jgi:hypothetical protein
MHFRQLHSEASLALACPFAQGPQLSPAMEAEFEKGS